MLHDESIVSLLQVADNEYHHKFTQLLKEIRNPIVKVFLSHHLNKTMFNQEKIRYLSHIIQGTTDDWDGDITIKEKMDKFWEVMRKQVNC